MKQFAHDSGQMTHIFLSPPFHISLVILFFTISL